VRLPRLSRCASLTLHGKTALVAVFTRTLSLAREVFSFDRTTVLSLD
jgi:hypothetical protein